MISTHDNDIKLEFKNHGLTGLQNLGNTCFMNTAIHCVSNTIPLTSYFLSNAYLQDLNEDKKQYSFVKEWVRLLKVIWSNNCTISPNSFHDATQKLALECKRDCFTGLQQNDTQEFIQFFIDSLHEGLCKEVDIVISGKPLNQVDNMALEAMNVWKTHFKSSYSTIIDTFYGQYVSKIMSTEDNTDSSHQYEPFCYLTLPIPNKNNIDLYDCLKCFCKTEHLTSGWESEKYNKNVKAVKQIMFWSTPKILIISINRYQINKNQYTKNNCLINFPLQNLNLENFCVGYDKYKSKYDLYGICNHNGTINGGHYWCYIKNENGKWHKHNDEDVTIINEDNIITSKAYCLFYKKI